MNGDAAPMIRVVDLGKRFPVRRQGVREGKAFVHAVQDVNLEVQRGETLGLVGESGSGKTTAAMMIAGLMEPSVGTVYIDGRAITGLRGPALRQARRSVQVVFQNPYTSLNPRLSIRQIVAEPLRIEGRLAKREIDDRVIELLELTGVPMRHADRTAEAFSGGQRQRIAIARALALNPPVLVCDEPTSALDVSVQARIINLLTDVQAELNISIVFVSHDLNVVRLVSDRVAVMYLGRVVEVGPTDSVFSSPEHPYSAALTEAIPDPRVRSTLRVLEGEIPSNIDIPSGCAFKGRCPRAAPECEIRPELRDVGTQEVACHFAMGTPRSETSISDSST